MRFYIRHLYTNFRDLHKGMELRKQLWSAARATTIEDFHKAMETMKATDVEAYKWLAEKPPMQWSKSYYSTLNKCDLLVNNLCEGFNKDIMLARDKPIITMLEGIRCYLMKRMTKRREQITTWEHNICPNIIDKVEKYKKDVVVVMQFGLVRDITKYMALHLNNIARIWKTELVATENGI
ncbi:uncharacterized protein LOC131322291 isoform X1 [Rhododendron vialii]|uniref:uncharacterized protein LOC131322291 isoform X1 n=1 Tax=Rhododendron vialii TaxID=182163 RepID=UPI00265D9F8D|nr:uncharacterized protein LOC131322291 isoform X1 [Rhododendron vialii]